MLHLGKAGKDPMGPAHSGLARFLAARTNRVTVVSHLFLYPVLPSLSLILFLSTESKANAS